MKKYKHFVFGENNISGTPTTYIIKLDPPAVSIRFTYNEDAMFSDFNTFFNSIADVQFLNNDRPNQADLHKIYVDAWNFLCLEEQKLDDYNG